MELLVEYQISAVCDMQHFAFWTTLKLCGKQNRYCDTR